MDLPIEVFEIMAGIAEENKVKSVKWGRASGLSPSEISDFKRLQKETRASPFLGQFQISRQQLTHQVIKGSGID